MNTRWMLFAPVTVALSIAALLPVHVVGADVEYAMAERPKMLGWEWRAGRELGQRGALRIVGVLEEGGGLFGLGRAPSLGSALPDARVVEADVVAVDRPGPLAAGQRIKFRVPKVELRGAGPGSVVGIGVLAGKVVCLAVAPADMKDDALAQWLSRTTFD